MVKIGTSSKPLAPQNPPSATHGFEGIQGFLKKGAKNIGASKNADDNPSKLGLNTHFEY